ncbi:protein dispatched homolog 3-like [Littorina saxatilis]|uniref:SSD domain-containing protein n=1 Tax=Littorina saxatilis TaxID=31220 RepID=A0AAN9AX44_9CAEN
MSFFKTLLQRWGRQGDGYQPVNNGTDTAEEDPEDMDDLMLMANEADSSRYRDNTSPNLEDGAVFSSFGRFQSLRPQRQNICRVSCECGVPSTGEKLSLWLVALALFTIVATTSVSTGLGYYSVFVLKPEPVIDKSIDSFSIPNHPAYVNFGALNLARKYNHSHWRSKRDVTDERFRRDVSEGQPGMNNIIQRGDVPLQDLLETDEKGNVRVKRSRNILVERNTLQVIKRWKMQVIYLAQGDDNPNIFTEERLKMIHKIEQDIMTHHDWKNFCLRDPRTATYDPAVKAHNDCAPLNSLLSYFFPSETKNGEIFYDGFGDNLGDVSSALKLAMNHDSFYYFVDEKINKTYKQSHMMRTEVLFGAPLQGFHSLGDHSKLQMDKYKEFVISYVDLLSKASTDKVRVLYGSNELFDYEVEHTFWNDVRLAIFAVASIAFIMFLMTSFSFFLTLMGLWCIVLAFPIAIFFYRVVFNIVGLGIMNGAAAFVIIGIGVDDVFVFINIFRQTTHLKTTRGRLLYTIRTAGYATFCTSFTTAMAFTCNLTSAIPAVYEFGLFMSLIVAGCWITVFLIMPATLYLYAFWFEPLEHMCGRLCCHCIPSHNTVAEGSEPNSSVNNTAASQQHSVDDDDVPLLQMENDDSANENSDDVAMLVVPEGSALSPEAGSTSSIGRLQQYLVGALVDRVVIRFRIPFIVLYSMVFVVSIGLMTQLRPSSHPPQLFKPDTNLQRLLDLKANFSMIDTLHCDRCSALYNVGHESHNSPPISHYHPHETRAPPATTSKPPTTKATFPLPKPEMPVNGSAHGGGIDLPVQPTWKFTTPVPPPTTTTRRTTTAAKIVPTPSRGLSNHNPPQQPAQPAGDDDGTVNSVAKGYDPCKNQNCNNIKARPILQSGATVYVVFGIAGVNRTGVQQGHVLSQDKGRPLFDKQFADEVGNMQKPSLTHLRELCQVCHILASNSKLVKNGSAQCLPRGMPYGLARVLDAIPECKNLPKTLTIYNHQAPSHAEASVTREGKLIWLAFAFESTVSKGESYFEAYEKYKAWEKFIIHIKKDVLQKDSPLHSIYQTSEFWEKVLMEMVAIDSAAYSVVLSLVVCMCAVAVFTGHLMMLLVIMITIIALIGLVVAIFFMVGWQMGGVEAVSLSILVGSSVDYCVHLVEGYLLMGKTMPAHIASGTNKEIRRWRTSKSVQHIGASIISSAVTTIVAAIPLTQTVIQPFSKFGDIVLINSSVAILYTLTLCVALLATIAPAKFVPTWRSHLKAFVATSAGCGVVVLALYITAKCGVDVPGPNGVPLFG